MASVSLFGFFLCAMALSIAPGPDVLFVFSQSLAQGYWAGWLVTLGLCTGLCVHVTLAAVGAAAFLKRYPKAFSAVTWFGAAYLVYLAFLTWRGAGGGAELAEAERIAPVRLYLRGIVMNLLNPKVMLFFLAFVPRFVRPERGRVTRQFLVLGALFIVATLLVFGAVALLGGGISRLLERWPRSYMVLQYVSAFVMLGIAAWIAWMNCRGQTGGGPAPEPPRRA